MIYINKKYLPSKKFTTSLLFALALILLAVLFTYIKPSNINYKEGLVSDIKATSTLINLDSDGDTIPDWKEILYGTDPYKADTDGDGTNDNIEIAQNRDPLKANTAPKGQEPNDKLNPIDVEKNKKNIDEYNTLSNTDKIARDLMSNIIASLPSNGQQIDQSTVDYIAGKAVNEIPTKTFVGITKISDINYIKIIDNKISEKDMSYYASVYQKESESFKNIMAQDLVLIDKYLKSGENVKKPMAEITAKYQTIVNNLIKVPVPALKNSYLSEFHLLLINYFEKIIQIDNDIINKNDAATTFADLSAYNDTISGLLVELKAMDKMFKIKRSF